MPNIQGAIFLIGCAVICGFLVWLHNKPRD